MGTGLGGLVHVVAMCIVHKRDNSTRRTRIAEIHRPLVPYFGRDHATGIGVMIGLQTVGPTDDTFDLCLPPGPLFPSGT